MKKHTLLFYLLLCLCVGTQAQIRGLKIADDNGNFTLAANEKRVALLIGNSQYEQQGRLKNPKNDATDMAAKLRNLGFDTQLVTDANRQSLVSAVRTFREKAKGSQTVALFFYAGHGVQVNGENYLVPVDADLQTESDVTTECYALSSLLNDLNNTALKVVILDACRDNPFQATQTTRGGNTRGLAQVKAATGTYIAYSTAPGTTAADGSEKRNSPYTAALLAAMDKTDISIEQTFKVVRQQLKQQGQEPWENSSLTGEFYFNYTGNPAPAPTPTPPATADSDNDGIIDSKDHCPTQYGDISNYGCPKSTPPTPPATANSYTEDPNGLGIVMQKIKGGTFTMGSNDTEAGSDEKPTHSVTLDDFYMGKYEVTQAQWAAVMGTTLSNPSYFKGDNLPVEQVSWEDIQVFLEKLNQKTGKNYRLPTEAQWEYAARGGHKSSFNKEGQGGFTYAGSNNLDKVAWYDDNSGDTTHPVGQKKPNELGLYDMSGNVWEWCQDWYGSDYYKKSPTDNPTGPTSGAYRVLRGGSWDLYAVYCRVAYRRINAPGSRPNISNGFRLVLVP
jgi:formylglycine-generating enzyme required for sulfatase activity